MQDPEITETMGSNESSTTKIDKLKTEFKSIFDRNLQFFGHGTLLDFAPQIFKEGLKVRDPDLLSTSVPLFDNKPYDKQPEEHFKRILNWPHHNAPAVVVLAIPNMPDNLDVGIFNYLNAVLEELETEDTGYNAQFVIPSKYIRGYVNTKTGEFTGNPEFRVTIPKIQPWQKPKPRRFQPTSSHSKGKVEIPATSPKAEKPDVW